MSSTISLPSPPDPPEPSADTVTSGPLIPAIDRMRLFSPNDWEAFVLEWADSLRSKYDLVEWCGGAGDMGRDVIATVSADNPDVWDNYQCKHYDHPLAPTDIWVELGKAVYYSYQGEFTFPREYRFIAQQGVGTALIKLFKRPDELKARLIGEWDRRCRCGITSTAEITLDGDLRRHFDSVDLSVIGYIPAQRLLDEHRNTPWHIARFGGGLPTRPQTPDPPVVPANNEVVYLTKLLDAYADNQRRPVAGVDDLDGVHELIVHYGNSRKEFYSAESLRAFSRDTLPPGSYEGLQDEVLSGVQDILHGQHPDGYRRVLAVVHAARQLQLTRHALVPRLHVRDRGGICHQLANDRAEVGWVTR